MAVDNTDRHRRSYRPTRDRKAPALFPSDDSVPYEPKNSGISIWGSGQPQ